MTLASGVHLGPYEILSLLGAGGMGEVYRARDPRLGRDIALKVLPPSFASDPDRLRRFEQEARAVAALSHPNIVALYDIGHQDGTAYIATELLEGESLRDILARGAVSHRKAVAWATQIAQGLAAAHARTIVHRDLKPDNIFITRDGQAKILDFGLAKAVEKPGSHADATITVPGTATGEGIVMGTVGYMSPEQVRGAPVDPRTDIFSFGAVLYEMLTGQRAFKRDTAAETMTAILNDEPPEFQDSGQRIPPALDRIARHCLEKSPDHRFQSARDLAFDLDSLSTLTGSAPIAAAKGHPRRGWIVPAVLVAIVLIAGFLGWRLALTLHPVRGARFHQLTWRRGTGDNARYSPDGRTVFYTAAWEGAPPEIYSVPANGSGAHPLGISNARLLSVSKQGELAVALAPKAVTSLLSPGALARVAQDTAPKPEIENIQAADFAPDGSGLAIVRYLPTEAICQLEYPIGHVLARASAILNVRFSPNGKYLAFDTHSDPTDDRGTLVILRADGRQVAVSPIFESLEGLAWNPSGSEVWFTSPLESGEVRALSLSGKIRIPLSVAGRLYLRDIAPNGQILAAQGIVRRGFIFSTLDGTRQRDLSWLDYGFLRGISNDGKTVLFEEEGTGASDTSDATYTVFIRGTDGSPAVALGPGYGLALSPDKQWALADKLAQPVNEVWLLPVGAGEARRLSPPNLSPGIAASFLPDSQHVVYIAHEPGRPMRAWLQNIDGAPPRPITPEGLKGWLVSPDGKWLLAGKANADAFHFDRLVPLDGGPAQPVPGLPPAAMLIGWTADGQVYEFIPGSPDNSILHFEKLNPRTGAHVPFRDIAIPRLAGAALSDLFFTPDGSAYAWGYRFGIEDLYTIDGAS
ncbi:MAG: protein kinase [Acidobacteriaceae bacterium]